MTRVALLVLVACGTKSAPKQDQAAAPPPAGDPTPPQLRLPTTARPLRNVAELTIDPAAEVFAGSIAIELETTAPLDVLWLNALELEIDDAQLDDLALKPVVSTNYAGLVPAKQIAAGKHTLRVSYRGKMTRNDGNGIYTAQEAGAWYAFTQFEATDARRAFPCFDEPSFKVPWQLTIRAPKDLVTLSNTPVESERIAGPTKITRFAETPPLPSYLVAFAVGPFDFVDAGHTRSGVPMRIVVPRGRAADAAYPAEVARELVAAMEDYFGTPYPYKKLDHVAVSVFNAGAMEHPGLITYRQSLVLTKPEEMTLARQQAFAVTAAHEIAHQWFGNLVTLAWWDDVWLNEAFATWIEAKIVDNWKPEWELAPSLVAANSRVMRADSLDSARTIRQPIESHGDIESGFDGITYQKGRAVLTMLERWIGPEVFRDGVRRYLAEHAWKTATYFDFVAAMTTAAGKDVKPIFDSFVLQSGLPKVAFTLSCDGPPKLALAQERYKPTGSQIDPQRTWHLPICVRWGAGEQTGRACTVLAQPTGELALGAATCPDWVVPNEGSLGYYRMHPRGALLDALLAHADSALALPERVGLVYDIDALVAAGDVNNAVGLSLVDRLAKDKSRHIVDASIEIVAGIDEMVPERLRPNYERLIRRLYRARAVELGWHAKKGETAETKQLRPALLALVAGKGRDKQLIGEASILAQKWLDDHAAIDPEVTPVALAIAAQSGDARLFDRVHAAAKQATDRDDRGKLLAMLGAFGDPGLVARAMAISITDEFELREALGLLRGGFENPRTREASYRFVVANYDKILAKLPEPYRPYMALTFVALCDEKRKAEIERFWTPRIEKLDGGPRALKQAMEAMLLCAAARQAQTPAVATFLQRQ